MNYTAETKSEIIKLLALDINFIRDVRSICKKEDVGDLLQEVYLILLNKKDELIIKLNDNNQLKYYVIRIVANQYNSVTSEYAKNYKNTRNDLYYNGLRSFIDYVDANDIIEKQHIENKNDKITFILNEIENLDWYSKKLMEMYFFEKKTYDQLEEQTKINRVSIWNTINKAKKQIKNNYDNTAI